MAKDVIEELLAAEAERMKLKRERLRRFNAALNEARRSWGAAHEAAAELLAAGDITRADLAKHFALTRAEKAEVLAVRPSPASPEPEHEHIES